MRDSNFYYNPEKFGLTVVAETNTADSWEFNISVVYRDTEGRWLLASDSGCSCPTPFSDHQVTDMIQVWHPSDLKALLDRQHQHSSDAGGLIAEVVEKCVLAGLGA